VLSPCHDGRVEEVRDASVAVDPSDDSLTTIFRRSRVRKAPLQRAQLEKRGYGHLHVRFECLDDLFVGVKGVPEVVGRHVQPPEEGVLCAKRLRKGTNRRMGGCESDVGSTKSAFDPTHFATVIPVVLVAEGNDKAEA